MKTYTSTYIYACDWVISRETLVDDVRQNKVPKTLRDNDL